MTTDHYRENLVSSYEIFNFIRILAVIINKKIVVKMIDLRRVVKRKFFYWKTSLGFKPASQIVFFLNLIQARPSFDL